MYKFSVPWIKVYDGVTSPTPDVYTSIKETLFLKSKLESEPIRRSSGNVSNSTDSSGLFEITNGSNATYSSRSLIMIVVCFMIVIIISLVLVYCYRKRKNSFNLQSENRNISDNLYVIDNFVKPLTPTKEFPVDDLNKGNEEGSVFSVNDCQDCKMISTLPLAFLKLPDMLYPRCSIMIEEGIGYGNFGTVLKGNLRIGKAR